MSKEKEVIFYFEGEEYEDEYRAEFDVKRIDDSFDHEFGTERRFHYEPENIKIFRENIRLRPIEITPKLMNAAKNAIEDHLDKEWVEA